MREQGFETLRALIRERWREMLLAATLAAVARCAGVPLALLTRRIVNAAGGPGNPTALAPTLWIAGLGLAGLACLQGACLWGQTIRAQRFAQSIIAELRLRMLNHLHQLSIGYFDGRAPGTTLLRFIGDASALRSWIVRAVVAAPADVLTILAVVGSLAFLGWPLLVAAVAPLLLVPMVLLRTGSRIREHTRLARREQSHLAGELSQSLSNIASLKAANAEHESVRHLKPRVLSIGQEMVRRSWFDGLNLAAGSTAASLSLCAIGICGSVSVRRGDTVSGDVMAAIWLALLLRSSVRRLLLAYTAHQHARVSGERIEALLRRAPESGRQADAKESSGPLLRYTGKAMRIRLNNLGYRDRRGAWIVRGLSATVQGPGCFRVVGEARQRRTLFELILRLRRPHAGRVALDGTNTRKLCVEDIRDRIGWLDDRRAIIPATLTAMSPPDLELAWRETTELAPDADLDVLTSTCEREATNMFGRAGLRLAISCALARNPTLLLLENPSWGLEDNEVRTLATWLERVSRERLVLLGSDDPRLEIQGSDVIHLGAETRPDRSQGHHDVAK
jgi:subfamily B ATP-binding cassette protein MsbA